eukprot:JP448848.1.p1 GENE.JP448848.1~~JP448848.1.p1  ORF type:complete len:77 (+),score=24.27 JP448848.1:28-231(+)
MFELLSKKQNINADASKLVAKLLGDDKGHSENQAKPEKKSTAMKMSGSGVYAMFNNSIPAAGALREY